MEFVLQHAESLKEQLADKDAEITKLRESLRLREEEFIQMQQKVELFETAGVLSGNAEAGKKEARLKINELVREIDKCIALLNK